MNYKDLIVGNYYKDSAGIIAQYLGAVSNYYEGTIGLKFKRVGDTDERIHGLPSADEAAALMITPALEYQARVEIEKALEE